MRPSERLAWAAEVVAPAGTDRVLEVGCGHGVLLSLLADQLPEGLSVGDEIEATGTVEERDVFTVDDYEALQAVADEETAQLYVGRGEELILVDATVTRLQSQHHTSS